MMKEVKKSSMSFQILNFVNGKTREKPYQKKKEKKIRMRLILRKQLNVLFSFFRE